MSFPWKSILLKAEQIILSTGLTQRSVARRLCLSKKEYKENIRYPCSKVHGWEQEPGATTKRIVFKAVPAPLIVHLSAAEPAAESGVPDSTSGIAWGSVLVRMTLQ